MKKVILLMAVLVLTTVANSCKKRDYEMVATLYGVIADSDTGNLITNASVVLSPGGKTKTTGSDGRFEFNELDPQQYTVTVQKTGYRSNRKTVTAVVDEETEVNILLTKE